MTHEDYCRWVERLQEKTDWDGFAIQSVNDCGFVLAHSDLFKEKKLYLLPSMNIYNHLSVLAFFQWGASVIGISNEVWDYPLFVKTRVHFPAAIFADQRGAFVQMLLKQCPAAMLRGCTAPIHCAQCPFHRMEFADAYDRRVAVRQDGYTEIYGAELVDRRANWCTGCTARVIDRSFLGMDRRR